ncbi:MAG TPA: hypothetical protein VHU19_10525 [Pyrinomonadaceae bacterium]|jgi:hypothetical protein|nr:hypothetical protein [Pyrinomonadaceae bacterium]
MPYQEESRDVPAQFQISLSPGELKSSFIPVVIAGSVKGRGDALAAYRRILNTARELYEKNVEHYRRLSEERRLCDAERTRDFLITKAPSGRSLPAGRAWARTDVAFNVGDEMTEVEFNCDEGSDVYVTA